ncbi:MAG: hypothetical protein WCP16_13740 [Pseudanabaena sp. ELA645]
MNLGLELIATAIQQLHELKQVASLPISSQPETTNIEDAVNVLQFSLTELENYQRSLGDELDKYRELFDYCDYG